MKKLFLFAALMMAAVVSAMDVVVYENTFTTSSETQMNNVQQGTPAVLWTNTRQVIAGEADPPAVPKTTSSYLQIAARKATGAQGRNILTAPIANFNTPFADKLSEIEADSVVWTFNMRYNYEGCSGFDATQRGIASVLVSDNEDLTEGNGYAVVINQTGYYKLVRFADGLDASANVTTILSTPQFEALESPALKKNCRFVAIKVVYVPATNTWRLFYAVNPSNSFVAPANVEWTESEGGAVVDATHTDKSMTHFGFLNKYSGNVDATMFIKNYKVMAYGYEPTPWQDNATSTKMYSASFTAASSTSMAGHSYGTPNKATWTNTKYNYGTADDCPDPTIQSELNVPGLRAADSKGRNILTAPMSGFGMPWTGSLSEAVADSIVWKFNMRYNYDYTGGFDNEQRGIATVLAMDDDDMMTANGYAIVSNASYYYRLVRFDGGLSANDNITVLASTAKLTKNDGTGSSNKRFMSFRVVYIPTTNTWRMYYFANTSSAYVAPDDVITWTLAGSVVDDTHTDKQMTHFGFMNNYVQGNSFDATLSVKNLYIGAYSYTPVTIDEEETDVAEVIGANDGEVVNAQLVRTFTAGMYNTICLPFNVDAAEMARVFPGAEIKELSSAAVTGDVLELNFTDASAMVAGTPYLIMPAAEVANPAFLGVTIDNTLRNATTPQVNFVGAFTAGTITASEDNLFLGANNTLYFPTADIPILGMRGYFVVHDIPGSPKALRAARIVTQEQVTTGIDNANAGVNVQKVLRDGQLIIIRNGVEYNINGQIVK